MQGNPLAMIEYGLGVLSLIRDLRAAHPKVTQIWHDDDTGEGRNFLCLQDHLDDILVWGPPRGYLPDQNKSILVVSAHNVAWSQRLLHGRGMINVMGS